MARIVALDKAEFKDRNYWAQEQNYLASISGPPMEVKPLTIAPPIKVAQQVPPTGVDRFKIQFQLDHDAHGTCGLTEDYALRAVIHYDETKELMSRRFVVRISYPDDPRH